MTVLQYIDPCISYHYIRTREEEIQLFICDVIASLKKLGYWYIYNWHTMPVW